MSKVYLSLGSNLGDSFYYLLNAIIEINRLPTTRISKVSSFYSTKAWGLTEQPDFLNCCIEIYTDLLPYKLLKKINSIEANLERTREIHWGPRTIDIDIIFYDNLKINDNKLTIPHKYYKQRNFVLIPLLDILWDKSLALPFVNKETKGDYKKFIYPKKIGISACLLGDNVKYDGGNNYTSIFAKVLNLKYLKICPETSSGLKAPRVPSEIKNDRVFSKDGEELTEFFLLGAKKTAKILLENRVDIAIMKSKSPSCGYGKIYDGSFSKILKEGNGITVDFLLQEGIKIIST